MQPTFHCGAASEPEEQVKATLAIDLGNDPPYSCNNLQYNLAFIRSIPVIDAGGLHFNEHNARGIDTLLKPPVQIASPMSLECNLISDQLGVTFDSNINCVRKDPALACKAKCHLRICLYVRNRARLLKCEIV